MQRIINAFPALEAGGEAFRKAFFENAVLANLPPGQGIAGEGQACTQLALVLSGRARVYKLADSGREITLYRIKEGESCVLTASCIMSDNRFPAIAETETAVEAIIVPADKARAWMHTSPAWSAFIFSLISRRLADVIMVLEEVAFQRMDTRIAGYLMALIDQGRNSPLHLTHHQIAADLGSSREVVSRVLKDLEGRGLVKVARGEIALIDPEGLNTLRAPR